MPDYGESSYRRYSRQNDWKLEDLVAACSDAMIRFAYGYVKDSAIAEDLMEDAFTDLLMQKKKFDSHQQIQAYLYKALRHRAIDHLRKHKNYVPLEDVEHVLACEDTLGNIFKKKRDETLYLCIQSLPDQYRDVLVLSYFDDFTTEQICKVMGKTKKQVYNLLARAKVTLRQLLEKEGISHEDL